jgi:cytidylate kinase
VSWKAAGKCFAAFFTYLKREEESMSNPVITIAREYGSGGRLIGEKIANNLGIPFYDKELILLVAKKSGLSEDYIRRTEQIKSASFLYNLYMTSQVLPMSDQIFLMQSKIIQELAEKEPCVLIGRCADYVLRDMPNCMNVFIHAPLAERVRRASEEYGDKAANMEDFVRKQDKKRSAYYNYFSQNKWGFVDHYHLAINSTMGIDTTAKIIQDAAMAFLEAHHG